MDNYSRGLQKNHINGDFFIKLQFEITFLTDTGIILGGKLIGRNVPCLKLHDLAMLRHHF